MLARTRTRIAALTAQNDQLREERDEAQNDLAAARTYNRSLMDRIEALQDELNTVRLGAEHLNQAEKETAELRATVAKLEHENTALGRALQRTSDQLEQAIGSCAPAQRAAA